ncbi:MAG: antitoxin [Nanoarchaeota archaeon]
MVENSISARVELGDYANRVLGIIKIKYGLKDKSEALNKFIELYGDDILEKEASEEYIKKIIMISNNHFKKHGYKKMSLQELDKLCGV